MKFQFEIVPQNIDLTYAVADVFFGIAIAELVICLLFYGFILFIAIIYIRKKKLISHFSCHSHWNHYSMYWSNHI